MLVCDCGTTDKRHDYGCDGWRQPETPAAHHKPHVFQPRTNLPDPWGWPARGIPNPDKETQR
ncbi:hypothetical protein DEU38_103159 [Rhodococcus sp. AG1013]|uniref:hypothetical protein n=1 Tax=Rhodococcus sp. AG1013 TaxID=2183996 RepID=UPI000E0A1258|nr:hypothetical protein [Rhodococcus sp. AG1013]RDI32426.1 hypothetical protein DEU38_103159 [Rhodococcus sp. AG1013]